MNPHWTLQEAGNNFPAVVAAAKSGPPQLITRSGKTVAVLVSPEIYAEMLIQKKREAGNFTEFLLSMPKSPEPGISHLELTLRDMEF